jgi:hypothetical protein
MTVSKGKQYKTRVFYNDSILHHTSTTQKKQVLTLPLSEYLHSTTGEEGMETRKSSSPDTVLGSEDVKAFAAAKDELFIYLYQKRTTYFNRWLEVTENYFNALDKGDQISMDKQAKSIDDVIEKYTKRTERRRRKFKANFQHAVSDDGETIPFLNGMDVLIWPQDTSHRKALIQKEDEYRQLNQVINPDTRIPASDTDS